MGEAVGGALAGGQQDEVHGLARREALLRRCGKESGRKGRGVSTCTSGGAGSAGAGAGTAQHPSSVLQQARSSAPAAPCRTCSCTRTSRSSPSGAAGSSSAGSAADTAAAGVAAAAPPSTSCTVPSLSSTSCTVTGSVSGEAAPLPLRRKSVSRALIIVGPRRPIASVWLCELGPLSEW